MAPGYFHPRILTPALFAKCPGNRFLGRSAMRGHFVEVEWEPTVHCCSASSEDMGMLQRGSLLWGSHSLKQKFGVCHAAHA